MTVEAAEFLASFSISVFPRTYEGKLVGGSWKTDPCSRTPLPQHVWQIDPIFWREATPSLENTERKSSVTWLHMCGEMEPTAVLERLGNSYEDIHTSTIGRWRLCDTARFGVPLSWLQERCRTMIRAFKSVCVFTWVSGYFQPSIPSKSWYWSSQRYFKSPRQQDISERFLGYKWVKFAPCLWICVFPVCVNRDLISPYGLVCVYTTQSSSHRRVGFY